MKRFNHKSLLYISSIVFGVIFGIIGFLTLMMSRAAAPSAHIEAESGLRSGRARLVSDASASGGQYVEFSDESATNIPVTSAPALLGLSVYAESTGTNPAEGPLSERFAPSGITWNEYVRFQSWVGGYELATSPEYPANKDTTWTISVNDALNRVVAKSVTRPARADGKRRPLVMGLPLLLPSEGTTTLAQVARGDVDESYYKPIRQALIDAGLQDTIFRLGWESNCECYDWGNTNPETGGGVDKAAQFKAAYRHVVEFLKNDSDGKTDDFEFVFDTISNGYTIKSGRTKSDAELLYPGDDLVDYIGMDIYNHGTNNNRQLVWDSRHLPSLDALASFASAHGKPIVIPEWGMSPVAHGGGGDDPIFVRNMLLWINSHPVAWHQSWNRWVPLKGGPYKLYPVYCTMPVLNEARTDYTCSRQSSPQLLYPNASAAFKEVLQSIRDSL